MFRNLSPLEFNENKVPEELKNFYLWGVKMVKYSHMSYII